VNAAELTGRDRAHIVDVADPVCALHEHAIAPFLSLREAAAAAGFDLVPVSSFRDFERQLSIWNGKFSGEKPVYGDAGQEIDVAKLAPPERIAAILRWSALPGASRHHWGTDLDLIDRNALPPGYRVRLVPAEFAPGGPFAAVAAWLDLHATRFGFFRPYRGVTSGVQAEPWHFSFAPVAENARRGLTAEVLREAIGGSSMFGKDEVLAELDTLHARFVANIDRP
jgi:LAS superfamily LD-carboxypeptidase LdcB